jgi:hypothetical protein
MKPVSTVFLTLLCWHPIAGYSTSPPLHGLASRPLENNQQQLPLLAQQLLHQLDNSRVEEKWLNHRHINWLTGEPDRPVSYRGPATHSHCSAFVAAMAQQRGIYLLRPPQHAQVLLANAQLHWLSSEAAQQQGWQAVSHAWQAQQLANQGMFVVVGYANTQSHKPGHIAIVRPGFLTEQQLAQQGPDVTQAGVKNFLKVTARKAFKHHPAAWPDAVHYFAHP